VRLIANVDSGYTQFQWDDALPNKTLKLEDGTLEAENIKVTSANFDSKEYNRIYVGLDDNIIKYRTKAELKTDLELAQVYNYKGIKENLNALKAITSANIGDVYFLSDTSNSWACKQNVTAATGDNYETYWSNLGKNVDLSGYVTLDTEQTIIG
jgi:hypothetical protein